MWWSRGQVPPSVLQSEVGFLALAGREGTLTPREALVKFRDLVSADLDWADHGFFAEQQDIWRDVSRQWIEFRRLDPTPRERNRESPP